jgi:hypothetical protein
MNETLGEVIFVTLGIFAVAGLLASVLGGFGASRRNQDEDQGSFDRKG